ncbi:MAG TPA: hypothetical protein VMS08_06075 [Candidatus Saccharimonadia bacterium]|nr:hypothetical protein [Candidatus Saccharimonadia bacterium]
MLTSNHMQNSSPKQTKFWIIATLVIVATAAAIAASWPHVLVASHKESTVLVTEASGVSGGEAQSDYQLAAWLDSNNKAAYIGLAASEVDSGQAKAAGVALKGAGSGPDVAPLTVRTYIELGQYQQAAAKASLLTTPGSSDTNLLLAALAYGLDNHGSEITALLPRISSSDALQGAQRAQAGNLALASELYATGLLNSSKAMLLKLPVTYERNLLLSRIYFSQPNQSNLLRAEALLTTAISLQPASINARQLLTVVYRDENKLPQASWQAALVSKLQSGRP